MVVFVDLDASDSDLHIDVTSNSYLKPSLRDAPDSRSSPDEPKQARENPNVGKFSEALACYPYADLLNPDTHAQ